MRERRGGANFLAWILNFFLYWQWIDAQVRDALRTETFFPLLLLTFTVFLCVKYQMVGCVTELVKEEMTNIEVVSILFKKLLQTQHPGTK